MKNYVLAIVATCVAMCGLPAMAAQVSSRSSLITSEL